MKIFYLIGSIIFTILILVIAFENVQSYCYNLGIFFYQVNNQTSPTFLIFGSTLLGIITGIFYFGLFQSILKGGNNSEEDEDDGF
ncbi:MAG: hypothetical protein UR27_C0014G0008 [Candidatus Peregrinibacteria bacterium GW2011_GWA2_33_10]|nr:MAG: hypothetical protein UR27_C0014G0008 [Candidatus Peregrinibacteria bacterium GW2011_GWA2_33_10]KKP38576.1 MAG: hypothetical protein UR30_C0017G0007 [Candidatus Peregrinibacteria bacterium GW2011_GWC2_33_13]OGJ49441.1 MAG: hypothetical protein A2229_00675 [Candidatus Peregrinibacteria bacterium RIFOXYA2_FULL_33_7]